MATEASATDQLYLVLHGHFYQPPRENPWLETIEREHGADPFPNWNARIAHECYRANAFARIFDDRGRAMELVNNYRYLSFNFGPTLLSWMQHHMPRVYRAVLQADRDSAARRSGHGNAIAQGHGHAILPLCNERDRRTQILWGKRDFVHRFGRQPESMWLPEAAIDRPTVEDLIDAEMRYVVLSPKQAARVRPLGAGEDAWRDVGPDKIDPRMPYRCLSERDPARHLDVFFYDGPVAHGISFEKVLHSSEQLADKLWGAVEQGRAGPQLVHAAVDGETYGHHMRHAERALSYAFRAEVPARGFTITNYGEYLERFPPTHEVELQLGPDGEGSSWSCAHGVGRWYRDCGCHAAAPEGWNQAWRGPLRRAVNLVRDEAAALFEEMGGELLEDPWAARDDYIELLLTPDARARERFLDRHSKGPGAAARQVRILRLLEMQRHSMQAQTSCGWFFNDISGLEATQVLKYAARTVQLYEELSGRDVEQRVLEQLAEAHSNIEGVGTGADVYRERVLPASVSQRRLVAQYAITDVFRTYPDELRIHGHQIHRVEGRRWTSGPVAVSVGRLQVELCRTGENSDVSYALIHFGGHDFHCAVRPFAGIQEFRRFCAQLDEIFNQATITELLRVVDHHFGEAYFGLQHLLAEEREEVLDALFGHLTERFAEVYDRLYRDHRRTVNALIDTGLKVPREFRMAAEYVLSRQVNELVREQRGSHDPARYEQARAVVREAERRGYRLDTAEAEAIFAEMLTAAIERLVAGANAARCREVLQLLDLADSLEFTLKLGTGQELLFGLVRDAQRREAVASCEDELRRLLERLELSPKLLPGQG